MADPIGRCVAGRNFMFWCASPTLFGLRLFGRPDGDDMAAMLRTFDVELDPAIPPHAKLIDCRFLEAPEQIAYERASGWIDHAEEKRNERITRMALLNTDGLTGAVAAGFFAMNRSTYSVEMFEDQAKALAWLDPAADPSLGADLDRIYAEVNSVDPLLVALRTAIEAQVLEPEIRSIAAGLAMSERTLQRRLNKLDTTFQHQVLHVRLSLSQRRMLASEAPLTHIALDVGFSSLQHFSTAFSKAFGVQPSAWRIAQSPDTRSRAADKVGA